MLNILQVGVSSECFTKHMESFLHTAIDRKKSDDLQAIYCQLTVGHMSS
jgi:hypothetical protein